MRRALLCLLVLPSFGMTCGPLEPPEPDSCGEAVDGVVDALEIGPERGYEQSFEPWAASDTAMISSGAQGGDMLGVTLRVTGAAPPACLAQRTRLEAGGEVVESSVPLHTYEEPDGSRTTSTLWLVFDGARPPLGSEVDLVAEAGGRAVSSRLTVVAERHRLVSVTPLTGEPQVPYDVTFEIALRRAPEYLPVDLLLDTSDPSVLGPPPGGVTAREDRVLVTAPAVGPGTAELIVRLGDQEMRAPITVQD